MTILFYVKKLFGKNLIGIFNPKFPTIVFFEILSNVAKTIIYSKSYA